MPICVVLFPTLRLNIAILLQFLFFCRVQVSCVSPLAQRHRLTHTPVEIDPTFPLDKRRRAEDILVQKKAIYHFQVFSGVSHGFAVRGNPEVENESEQYYIA